MTDKVKWGILGAARIAVNRVIPALQKSRHCEVVALASRDAARASKVARNLGIPESFGTYEQLLDQPDIEAVYIPLPNHLHVPWSIRAAEAGKHVLCEKPIALSAGEAAGLIDCSRRTGRMIQEAFMVRTHPRWLEARRMIREREIGDLRAVLCYFGYSNPDADNYRNRVDAGGGGLFDIGCYPITLSRFLCDREPDRVVVSIERDPRFGVDRLASAILEFPWGCCTFVCGTQLIYHQSLQVFGTLGRIELPRPFNPPTDRPSRMSVDLGGGDAADQEFAPCDQFTIQGDVFSKAIREGGEQAVPLEDSVRNMAVIDALFRSGESGGWESVDSPGV